MGRKAAPIVAPGDKQWVSVWLPTELKQKLRVRAAERSTSMSQLVVDILHRELNKKQG